MIDDAVEHTSIELQDAGSSSFYDCHSVDGQIYQNDENCDAVFRVQGEFADVKCILDTVQESPDFTIWSLALTYEDLQLSVNYFEKIDVSSILYTERLSNGETNE